MLSEEFSSLPVEDCLSIPSCPFTLTFFAGLHLFDYA